MPTPAVINPVMQKNASDCAIASLAMLLGRSYEEVSKKALELFDKPHQKGLTTREIQRLARAVRGQSLQSIKIKNANLDEETGMLFVKRGTEEHACVLFEGVIFDPADGLIWNVPTYFASSTKKCYPIGLLKP